MTDIRPTAPWPFVASIVVLAMSAASLLSLIPTTLDGTGAPVRSLGALGPPD